MALAIIGSQRVDSESRFKVYNPSTGEVLEEVPKLPLERVREAIEVAYNAQEVLQSTPASRRASSLMRAAEMIRARAEELARTMSSEVGRPIRSARVEISRTAQIFELAASEVRNVLSGSYVPLEVYDFPAGNERRFAMIRREPVGVVGSITPFNFPAASFAHKVAPALAVGNTVVHKPSSLAPLTQIKLAEILLGSGFPPGSVNVITGDSELIGEEFVRNDRISLITFTGSEAVGLQLASRAVAQGKRVIMELGGMDPMIVLEDADVGRAVQAALVGRFDYAGQFCNATKRIMVREEVAGKFEEELVSRLSSMRVGDALDEGTDVGPLISPSAVKVMGEFVLDATSSGGELVFQGRVPERGFFYPPTVLRLRGELGIRALREEVFGPVLPVIRVKDDEEAVRLANSTKYGLDAAIFSGDFNRAYRLACRIKAGTVMINDTTRLRWDNLPFGGFKRSGIGRESVRDTMLEMTESKVIVNNFG